MLINYVLMIYKIFKAKAKTLSSICNVPKDNHKYSIFM